MCITAVWVSLEIILYVLALPLSSSVHLNRGSTYIRACVFVWIKQRWVTAINNITIFAFHSTPATDNYNNNNTYSTCRMLNLKRLEFKCNIKNPYKVYSRNSHWKKILWVEIIDYCSFRVLNNNITRRVLSLIASIEVSMWYSLV